MADRRELALIAIERTRMPMAVTDPRQPDNPIVLANQAFLDITGYAADEMVGRNCRFLQGPDTDPAAVDEVRRAVADEREMTVELLNYRKDGSSFWNQLHISPIHDEAGQLVYYFASQMDVSRRRIAQQPEAAEHRLLREIDHRAKNALALVQGIVRLSRADDAAVYARSVQGRVGSIARAHGLLADRSWQDVPLELLIQTEITPFGMQRVALHGPAVAVAATQVQPLALVFHEMLANAVEHGALSTDAGSISIEWHDAPGERLVIEWRESGGPPPPAERTRGFGSTMSEAIICRQLNGTIAAAWNPGGLESTLVLRLGARG